MATTIQAISNLEEQLKSTANKALGALATDQQKLLERNAGAVLSKFGVSSDLFSEAQKALDKASGVVSLTQNIDDYLDNVPGSATDMVANKLGVVNLTSDLKGAASTLKKPVGSSNATDLSKITGSEKKINESLDVVISSAAPESVAAAMKNLNLKDNNAKSVINEAIIGTQHQTETILNDVIGGVFGSVPDFSKFKNDIFGSLDANLAANLAIVQNLDINNLLGNVAGEMQSLAEGALNNAISQVTSQFTGAINDFISPLQTDIGSIGSKGATGVGAGTIPFNSTQFPLVSTEEELIVELKTITREITECIVDWTETTVDQNVGAYELQKLSDKNLDAHYLILRDGSLQRANSVGETTGDYPNDHDAFSINIAFVGGINYSGVIEDYRAYLSSKSLTVAQFQTFNKFLRILYSAYPGIQVLGHNDLDLKQRAPGFSVSDYVFNLYGKTVILEDTLNKGPLTREELIAKSVM